MARGMKMGMIWLRSRIWTITDDTSSATPIGKGISMATYNGTHSVVSLGTKPLDDEEASARARRGHERREARTRGPGTAGSTPGGSGSWPS